MTHRCWEIVDIRRSNRDPLSLRGSPSGMLAGVSNPDLRNDRPRELTARSGRPFVWLLVLVGIVAAVASLLTNPGDARSSAAQNWSPFVLVTGLLLIGLVAD